MPTTTVNPSTTANPSTSPSPSTTTTTTTCNPRTNGLVVQQYDPNTKKIEWFMIINCKLEKITRDNINQGLEKLDKLTASFEMGMGGQVNRINDLNNFYQEKSEKWGKDISSWPLDVSDKYKEKYGFMVNEEKRLKKIIDDISKQNSGLTDQVYDFFKDDVVFKKNLTKEQINFDKKFNYLKSDASVILDGNYLNNPLVFLKILGNSLNEGFVKFGKPNPPVLQFFK